MTPKEKAKELVNKYLQIYDGRVPQAKQCALIAVDVVLSAIPNEYLECWKGESQMVLNEDVYYWQKVKKELEKL